METLHEFSILKHQKYTTFTIIIQKLSNKDTTYTLDKAPDFTPNEIIQPVDYKQIVNRPP